MYNLNSRSLLDFKKIKLLGNNINFIFDKKLGGNFHSKFPGYYLFKVPTNFVEKVYTNKFFNENNLSTFDSFKWKNYINSRKNSIFTLLDAHDYNGAMWKYLTSLEYSVNINYYGELFWIFHDIGHHYLGHSYKYGTFKHRDEIDASLFAIIKLLQLGIFNKNEILKLVYIAIYPLLKTGKYINKDDFKYFLYFISYFERKI